MIVYWVHRLIHTDVWSQGYIGITNNPDKRWRNHRNGARGTNQHLKHAIKAYDDIKMSHLFEGTEEECKAVELLFRPRIKIGWNLVEGGGLPPINRCYGNTWARKLKGRKHSPEQNQRHSLWMTGHHHNRGVSRPSLRQLVWWNDGLCERRSSCCPGPAFTQGRIHKPPIYRGIQ